MTQPQSQQLAEALAQTLELIVQWNDVGFSLCENHVSQAKAALAAYRSQPLAPTCTGDPGECRFNGACMYHCGRLAPPLCGPDVRALAKWLNEEPSRPIDREALARVLAAFGGSVELPERNRAIFCTKCGHGGLTKATPPFALCENPACGYMAFVEEQDYTADQLQSYGASREEAGRLKGVDQGLALAALAADGQEIEGDEDGRRLRELLRLTEALNGLTLTNWGEKWQCSVGYSPNGFGKLGAETAREAIDATIELAHAAGHQPPATS